jgi:predicted nucleic acid-binding protein
LTNGRRQRTKSVGLLERWVGQLRCLEWLGDAAQTGLLDVDRESLDFRAAEKLARKYADQPMDLADASLVLLAARSGIREVLTADRRDFAVYRFRGRIRFIDVLGDSQPGSARGS